MNINVNFSSEQYNRIERQLEKIMAQLDDLTAQVKTNTDVEASAIVLIQGLADKIQSAGTDAGKLQALQGELRASADALAAAVAANTASAPQSTPASTTTAPPTP